MKAEILLKDQSFVNSVITLMEELLERFFPTRVKVVVPKIVLPGVDFYFYFQKY